MKIHKFGLDMKLVNRINFWRNQNGKRDLSYDEYHYLDKSSLEKILKIEYMINELIIKVAANERD